MKARSLIALAICTISLTGSVVVGRALPLLASQSITTATTTNSAAKSIPSRAHGFVAWLYAVNNSGTTPTLDVKIQHSPDCSNWVDLESLTQCTTGTCIRTFHVVENTTQILPCVRAVAVTGGTAPNYTVTTTLYHD